MNHNIESTDIKGSYSFKFTTPDGVATVFIVEKEQGIVEKIDYFVGKAGSSVSAWAFALVEFINFSIKKGMTLNEVTNTISNITSGRSVRSINGLDCRSGPEAIFLALMKYRGMIKKNNNYSSTSTRIRKRN